MIRSIIEQFQLTWRLIRDERVPFWVKLIPAAAALYVLSPIDIIPDFLIGIGQLDDIGIILGAMRLMERFAPENTVKEHRKAIKKQLDSKDPLGLDNIPLLRDVQDKLKR